MQAFRILTALLFALLLSACFSEPTTALKVGVNKWVGYEPLFLARKLDAYDESIKLVELPNSSESISLLHNKLLDAAALTLDEVLSIINRGTPMTIILPFDFSLGADALVAHKNIESLSDLKGKRVGVEASASGALMVLAALDQAGLDRNDVHIVNLTIEHHLKEYRLGNIDALVTFEPVKSQVLKLGGHSLFDSRQVPGLIVDVLAVRTEVLESHALAIQSLVNGYYQARAYILENHEDAVQQMAPRLRYSVEDFQSAFVGIDMPNKEESKAFFRQPNAPIRQSLTRVRQVMLDAGMLDAKLPIDALISDQFLRSAL